MYLEFGHDTKRGGWTHKYLGSELVSAAEKLVEKYKKEEEVARKKTAGFLTNFGISVNSKEMGDAKAEAERAARIHEECQVYLHEFRRNPEREYNLSNGDVVFFGFPAPK